MDEAMAYRPEQAARVVSLSIDMIFKAIRSGALRSLKVGQARLITAEALREWLAQQAEGS